MRRKPKQKECETIANEIRMAAVARGIPTVGACTNPSAPELRDDCERLKACNAEVERL